MFGGFCVLAATLGSISSLEQTRRLFTSGLPVWAAEWEFPTYCTVAAKQKQKPIEARETYSGKSPCVNRRVPAPDSRRRGSKLNIFQSVRLAIVGVSVASKCSEKTKPNLQ